MNFKNVAEDKGKRTLVDLVTGILGFSVLAIVPVFFVPRKLQYGLGLLLGTSVALFMVFHMYYTLEKVFLCDNKTAKAKARFGAFLRLLSIMAALALSITLTEWLSVFGVVAGILSLKIAAFFQPSIDILVLKFFKKEE